ANEIVEATVPVVVFVTPSGTQAGAPGAFLLSAAHVAAMAPGTSFGSPYPLVQIDQALSPQTQSLVNDSLADQLRRWNRERGRGLAWIDRAVNEGVILTNEQAIAGQPPSIDIVAATGEQLLTFLDGRVITLANGATVQLAPLERPQVQVTPTLFETLWITLADPTVAFVLLVIGALAIYLEFAAPGTTLMAGIGVILLIGAAIGLVALPVRPWALALVVLAFVTIGMEFAVSSHGGLAVVGLVLLAVGSLSLIDPVQAPGAGVGTWAVAVMVAGTAALAAAGLVLAVRTRSRPVVTGQAALVGKLAEVRQALEPEGMVFVDGALWRAISEAGPIEAGEWVRVVAVHQLRLFVRPLERDAGDIKE
ncbi:MAG TPA: NfeD family protein, partial [Roseiflexaceae bacterium]|nr:NfeD family protein [Roseiflexaceae bacterium]